MNARNLIECLEATAANMGVRLEDLEVVFRDADWNIWQVGRYLQEYDNHKTPIFVLCSD